MKAVENCPMWSLRSHFYCCSLRSQRWGSFLSDAIYEAHAAKAICIRFAHTSLKAKDTHRS